MSFEITVVSKTEANFFKASKLNRILGCDAKWLRNLQAKYSWFNLCSSDGNISPPYIFWLAKMFEKEADDMTPEFKKARSLFRIAAMCGSYTTKQYQYGTVFLWVAITNRRLHL